ncbi:MAG: aldolase/citrate lyase family protein [Anaerolineae bacterium]|nr:aldolase/citrate lyase family protein [Thermoflexales bacterium]MDW8396722.1 aldolase/citrate lyase family protein [Anaerolineae bacterium]
MSTLETLRAIWASGRAVINGWCTIPGAWGAEIMARAGWDTVTVDLHHGLVDYRDAVGMFQAIQLGGAVPLARAPWNEPGIIMKLLDAGALGIICPMVNSGEECARFVGACRYAPQGYRSYGPTRARPAYGEAYDQSIGPQVLAFAMVETAQALNNLDAIASVPGLSGIYVGPADLSLSLGSPERSDPTVPHVVEAIERVLSVCKQRGLIAGFHCGSPAYAHHMIARGFQFVTVGSDGAFLAAGAEAAVRAMRSDVPAAQASTALY